MTVYQQLQKQIVTQTTRVSPESSGKAVPWWAMLEERLTYNARLSRHNREMHIELATLVALLEDEPVFWEHIRRAAIRARAVLDKIEGE